MDTASICPSCRRPLPADALKGLCPECLIKAGLDTGAMSAPTGPLSEGETAPMPTAVETGGAGVEPNSPPERRWSTAAIVGLIIAPILFFSLLVMVGIFWLWKATPVFHPVAMQPPQPVAPLAENIPISKRDTIPPRDPQAARNQIDLSDYYNGTLVKNWHNSWDKGNDLRELPSGLQTMAGTLFDVRGLIAVSKEYDHLGPLVEGIRIGQKCRQIHFLHSAFNAAYSNGEDIGHYLVHLANGDQYLIPIRTGQEVLDWHKRVPAGSPLVIAWEGENAKTRQRGDGRRIYLFKSTWENPTPDVEIKTLDLVGLRRGPSPFLVALTVE